MLCTVGMFLGAIAFTVISYIFYAHSGCPLHQFFVSLNLILCVIVSVISILPKIQEHMPRSGLLQAAAVSLYVMYLTWSAMTNDSDESEKNKKKLAFLLWSLFLRKKIFFFNEKNKIKLFWFQSAIRVLSILSLAAKIRRRTKRLGSRFRPTSSAFSFGSPVYYMRGRNMRCLLYAK